MRTLAFQWQWQRQLRRHLIQFGQTRTSANPNEWVLAYYTLGARWRRIPGIYMVYNVYTMYTIYMHVYMYDGVSVRLDLVRAAACAPLPV